MAPLALCLVLGVVAPSPAAGDPVGGPGQDQVNVLTAKITSEAARIHQLTQHLDQARTQLRSTTAKLAEATRSHDATVQALSANRVILHDQALRAYMRGGVVLGVSATSGTGDVSLGREYLKVASGNLADASERLRVLEANLRRDQAAIGAAQQSSAAAATQLQQLRANAVAIATQAQAQLDGLQVQLAAAARAQALAQAQAAVRVDASKTPAPPRATQGSPVNNGLIAVVQQAVGLPVSPPPVAAPPPAPPTNTGGSGAGGVWLQLRQCESGNNYQANTGNGYYGAYQFSQSTWNGLGYPGRPDQESPAMQDKAAMQLQAQSGWGQWPACSAALGLV